MSTVIFIIAIVIYYTIGKRCQSWILTALSLYAYWLAAGSNVIFLTFTAIVICLCARLLEKGRSKVVVAIPITILLGGFIFLKQNWIGVALPLGYSVLAFTSISLLIDQYRSPKHYGFIEMLSFLLFFPKIFAGPIERANNFIQTTSKTFNITTFYVGLKYLIFKYSANLLLQI